MMAPDIKSLGRKFIIHLAVRVHAAAQKRKAGKVSATAF